MSDDAIEEFYRSGSADREREECLLSDMRGALLSAGALVIASTSGLGALLGQAITFASEQSTASRLRTLEARLRDTETRLQLLEARGQALRLRGVPLQLLDLTMRTELSVFGARLSADGALASLGATAIEYRRAVQELEYLDLVSGQGNANHETGYARARLRPTALLRAGPAVVPEVDWERDVARLLMAAAQPVGSEFVLARTFAQATGIPLPRHDLLAHALADREVLQLSGMGEPAHSTFMFARLTPKGRRVLRGDEPLHPEERVQP